MVVNEKDKIKIRGMLPASHFYLKFLFKNIKLILGIFKAIIMGNIGRVS